MIYEIFNKIKKLQKEVNALKCKLRTRKKLAERELLNKQIKELELEIINFKKVTDDFLAKYVTDVDKKIIIDYYYNDKQWVNAIFSHITYKGDYNYDSYRRYIQRLLQKH